MSMAGIAVSAAGALLKKAYGSYAEDKTLMVPLAKPSNFELMTNKQIESKYCRNKKMPNIRITSTKKKKARKTNLEKIIERKV